MKTKTTTQGPVEVAFFKVGGTWDMVRKEGKLIGSGGLDDDALQALEEKLSYYKKDRVNFETLEKELTRKIAQSVEEVGKNSLSLVDHLSWVPRISKLVTGTFTSLYSGDSSHLRNSLIAPLVSYLLEFANSNPNIQMIGAQGTDTADSTILPLLDTYIYDTELLPFLFTGSNRSHREWNSDAPKNFSDLIHVVGAHLPTGVYWIFAQHLFRASDFVKIDSHESRRIENYSTFFSPRLTARFTRKVTEENHIFHKEKGVAAPKAHISQKTTPESLYRALSSVDVVDLGSHNNVYEDVSQIMRKDSKAVVISAHSLGNSSNPIRHAAVQAALDGKLVVIVDRTLIGQVSERYAAGLLGVNGKELLRSGKQVSSGHRMNKHVAKAIATRALEEGLTQKDTQELINSYCESRGLME